MAVSIKEEGLALLLDPSPDYLTTANHMEVSDNLELADNFDIVDRDIEGEAFEDDPEEEDCQALRTRGPPADIELEKLPRPASSLNCRQARSYLVKLLRAANGGQNPQYGNPNSKPPFWPDFYWPWSKLTDVHTKPRGMEEPLLYSEMMKLAIQRGYKYYGYDPETYWDKMVEEKEPTPVERGTPAPILTNQIRNLGLPPKLPRPNSKLNCVQARTVLSKLLRYQQAGNNPVYGHPETRPPWWPDECIRWEDMVDLRGKPPYLPPDMTYTDVLKHAIDQGLKYFGYNCESWVDKAQYTREINHSILSKKPVSSVTDSPDSGPPRLPIPINKMNCGLARTTLSRLLRYHCGRNPKYGTKTSMPVWWPNDVFEWTALKNLSHRYDGNLGDSYSNCLRLAIVQGYEHYHKDPYTYTEEAGEDLPTVAAIKRVKLTLNPQVSAMIQQFDDDIADEIADDPDEFEENLSDEDFDLEDEPAEVELDLQPIETDVGKKPLPKLIAISDIETYEEEQDDSISSSCLLEKNEKGKEGMQEDEMEEIEVQEKEMEEVEMEIDTKEDELVKDKIEKNEMERNEINVQGIEKNGSHKPVQKNISLVYSDGGEAMIDNLEKVDEKKEKSSAMEEINGPLDTEYEVDTRIPEPESEERIQFVGRSQLYKEKQCSKLRGSFPPLVTARNVRIEEESRQTLKRCRVDLPWLELDHCQGKVAKSDILTIARSNCERRFFKKLKTSFEDCSFTDLDLRFSDGGVRVHRVMLAASSSLLADILQQDPGIDCVVFPEVSVAQGRTAVEALYTGTAIIDRTPGGSLREMERCLSAFQEVGLLSNHSVQMASCPRGRTDIREKAGHTVMAGKHGRLGDSHGDRRKGQDRHTETHNGQLGEGKSVGESEKEKEKFKGEKERRSAGTGVTSHHGLRSPRSPRKFYESSDSSGKDKEKWKHRQREDKGHREDCKKPRFSELTEEKVREKSGLGQREMVDWLMEAGFLCSEPPVCRSCASDCSLTVSECGDGWAWSCCSSSPRSSLRDHSIFQFSKESLTWIVRIILCWRENTSLTMCHQDTGASIDAIFFWYAKCREFFGLPETEGDTH